MKKILAAVTSFIAIAICTNDLQALPIIDYVRDHNLTCPVKLSIQQIKNLKSGRSFKITLLNPRKNIDLIFTGTRTLDDISVPLLPWKRRDLENSIRLTNSQINTNNTKIDCSYSCKNSNGEVKNFVIFGSIQEPQ